MKSQAPRAGCARKPLLTRSGIWVEFQSVLFALPMHPAGPGDPGAGEEQLPGPSSSSRLPSLSDVGHHRLTCSRALGSAGCSFQRCRQPSGGRHCVSNRPLIKCHTVLGWQGSFMVPWNPSPSPFCSLAHLPSITIGQQTLEQLYGGGKYMAIV